MENHIVINDTINQLDVFSFICVLCYFVFDGYEWIFHIVVL